MKGESEMKIIEPVKLMMYTGFIGSLLSCIGFVYLDSDMIFPIIGGAGLTLSAVNIFLRRM